jgi:glycerol-3-phosphate dehydrogenase
MRRDLARLEAQTYDVLIIGGGIYGVCTAWEAALRGLSVALLEKGDFGQATSSNTLRVIHGGLRYLQHADFRRLRHSVLERTAFMRIAPHLVHPLPFAIPAYGHALRGKELLRIAVLVHDLMGFDRNRSPDLQKRLPAGRVLSREEFVRMFPGGEESRLTGGVLVYDCQMFSSERLVISFARSAALAGAQMANYLEVVELVRKGNRVAGVRAKDLLSGSETEICAKVVVNTAGPWVARVLNLGKAAPVTRYPALSKAFNILIKRPLSSRYALGIYAKTTFKDSDTLLSKGSRLLFLAPWHNRTLIGTVHLPYDCDPDECRVSEEEIETFLQEVNDAYPAARLARQDVCCTYSGLLPMVPQGRHGVQLLKHYQIRDHQRDEGTEGLISVMGVKFTEARHVAEKAVDLLVKKLGVTCRESQTATTPLHGGSIDQFQAFLTQESARKPPQVSPGVFQNLLYLYGSAYPEVLQYAKKDVPSCHSERRRLSAAAQEPFSAWQPGDARGGVQSGDASVVRAEVLYSVRQEMAQKLTDAVFRRTSLALPDAQKHEWIQEAASVMARELGWDAARTRREIGEVDRVHCARM